MPKLQQPPPPVAPYSSEPLPVQRRIVPLIFPVMGSATWRDNYNDNRGTHRHTGIDIRASKMTPILAPFSGILGNKLHSFWIVGDDGTRCLGTHLNDDTPGTNDGTDVWDNMFAPNLTPGGRVVVGQLIGYVGNSGDATGPHLHFELYGPEGIFNPTPSLRAARKRTTPLPVLGLPSERPAPGEVRVEGCFRGWSAATRTLTLQMIARQSPDGKIVVATRPARVKVKVPTEGALNLENLDESAVLSVCGRVAAGQLLARRLIPV